MNIHKQSLVNASIIVDARQKLKELHPVLNGAHYINIEVRIDGETKHFEADWLKTLSHDLVYPVSESRPRKLPWWRRLLPMLEKR